MNTTTTNLINRLRFLDYNVRESDFPFSSAHTFDAVVTEDNVAVHCLVEFGDFEADTYLFIYTGNGWDAFYVENFKTMQGVRFFWADVLDILNIRR